MLFGEELKKALVRNREWILEDMRERDERIAAGLTDIDDCFVSIRSEEKALSEISMQLDILKGDGLMEIEAVIDENGKEVNARWVETRYGIKIVGRGIFANSVKALCKKTGWHTETIKVPCWTKCIAHGRGMFGAYNSTYQIVRWHTNMVTGEYFGYPE